MYILRNAHIHNGSWDDQHLNTQQQHDACKALFWEHVYGQMIVPPQRHSHSSTYSSHSTATLQVHFRRYEATMEIYIFGSVQHICFIQNKIAVRGMARNSGHLLVVGWVSISYPSGPITTYWALVCIFCLDQHLCFSPFILPLLNKMHLKICNNTEEVHHMQVIHTLLKPRGACWMWTQQLFFYFCYNDEMFTFSL